MLLLTGVTFGGQDSLAAFDHLGELEGEALKHRASKLLEIPRDKRIPLLVQEIKRLVTSRRSYLWNAEPEAFAKLLSKEKPALREVILRALPVALADAVRPHLPPSAAAPDKELKPGVLAVVRWKLEQLLEQASAGAMWKFSDLLLVKPRELYTLCERQGVRALGIAFAALPKEEREQAFATLSADLRAMAQKATDAAQGRSLSGPDALSLLKMHGWEGSPVEAIRSAGIQRLARACMSQSPDFAARMVERHRPPFSQIFQKWLSDERTRNAARGDGGRAEIVAEMERLESRGLVEKPTRLPQAKPKPILPPPGPAQLKLPKEPSREDRKEASRAPLGTGAKPVPSSGRMPSSVIAPRAPQVEQPGPRRDPIAERAARKAGAASAAPPLQSGRDPIAERNARRAGAASARAPAPPELEGRRPTPNRGGGEPSAVRPSSDGERSRSLPPKPSSDDRSRPPVPDERSRSLPPRSSSGQPVLTALPGAARQHPGGIARGGEDHTDPVQNRPPPSRQGSASQPVGDPGGSRLHKRPVRTESRIIPAQGRKEEPPDPKRAPKVLGHTGSRPVPKVPAEKGTSLQRAPRPPGSSPGQKGPGRGPDRG